MVTTPSCSNAECEATPGKKLLANGGFDTLISPFSNR